MKLEYWNTIAALGTFLVITASAIAALIQLRHTVAAINCLVCFRFSNYSNSKTCTS
jgi:hypothetical protein